MPVKVLHLIELLGKCHRRASTHLELEVAFILQLHQRRCVS